MREVVALPPNFADIDAVFHVAGKPILYAYGDTIFNPHRVEIPPSLYAHEGVHGERQGSDVEGWWKRYLAEPDFRLAEEIPAHVAEYKCICATATRRNSRRVALHHIAARLSSQLYGGLIRYEDARKIIKEGV